jgi:Ribosomal protein L7/L12 C-terminal domain
METLRCPRCGSDALHQLGPAVYRCTACGTGFALTDVPSGFMDVVLVHPGKKLNDVVMTLMRATTTEPIIKTLDLAMAKRLAEQAPSIVVPNVPLDVAERVKAKLEKAGATVELKPA